MTPTPNSNGPTWFGMASGGFYPGDSADIALQNANGSVEMLQMNGTAATSTAPVTTPPYPGATGTSWGYIRATGDFYGDGNTDLLFQNSTGQPAIWDMNGATVVQSGIVANPTSVWQIKGTGDFYGDGKSDILWQNTTTGLVRIWEMNGTSIVQNGLVTSNPGPAWQIKGTGDFYGDGNTDVLWQNTNGQVAIWDMKGTTFVQSGVVATNPGPAWHIQSTGDFNNDGKTDIALQNENGTVRVWEMHGTTIAVDAIVPPPAGMTGAASSWNVVGTDSMRFINSGAANEVLAATPTTPDEFVFKTPAAGTHTITGFDLTHDIVELSAAHFANFAAVQTAMTSTGGSTSINLGGSSSLLLSGVSKPSLLPSNFALT